MVALHCKDIFFQQSLSDRTKKDEKVLTQGLFLEEQENRVKQLQILGQVVELPGSMSVSIQNEEPALNCFSSPLRTHVVQNDQRLSPTTIVVTDGVEDTIVVDLGNELLNEENQKDAADGGQVEVVNEEERLELERLTVAHQLATTENDHVVDDNESGGRLEGRHGRLERNELKLLGRISDDCLPGLAEDGP